jgi:hypothetical protein
MLNLSDALDRQNRLPRFLCHLFQRLSQGRLNIVTGAGISVDAKVPAWSSLLDRLAEEGGTLLDDLKEHRKAGLSLEYLGQIVYHRHRASRPESETPERIAGHEAEINHSWAQAIHKAIYDRVPSTIETIFADHPYLEALRDLAIKVPLIINFNFDDILAEAISSHRTPHSGRRTSVVWQPPLLDRPDYTTIYHVNGLLPRLSLKKRSPQLIFTEDSFADALARAPGISSEYILLRFVQNTLFIIGHSLNDTSLRNYLRLNRDRSPANHHYMVYWLEHEKQLRETQRDDIFLANLELYNVITIFLTSREIKEVLDLLVLNDRDFRDKLDDLEPDKRSRYHYYIVGSVASGKSTLLEHLRCFNTIEEWTRPPPQEMYRSFDSLSPEESKKVDSFVYAELKEKNIQMHSAGVGFHFVDRAPLDLYAFSRGEEEQKNKTKHLQEIVARDKPLQLGEVVFLHAGGNTLVERNYGRGRPPSDAGEASYLAKQAADLKGIYNPSIIEETDKRSAGEIAKRVARHALLDKYEPIDLNQIMKRYE